MQPDPHNPQVFPARERRALLTIVTTVLLTAAAILIIKNWYATGNPPVEGFSGQGTVYSASYSGLECRTFINDFDSAEQKLISDDFLHYFHWRSNLPAPTETELAQFNNDVVTRCSGESVFRLSREASHAFLNYVD